MKGMTHLPAGSFTLSDYLRLNVRASDDGTVLTITQTQSGKTTTATVNELGQVVARAEGIWRARLRTSTPDTPKSDPVPIAGSTPASPLRQIKIVSAPLNMSAPKPKRVRFTLRYTRKARPQNRPQALGAFTDGSVLHVLYRVQSGGNTYVQHQLRAEGDRVSICNHVPEDETLPHAEWGGFITLPEGTTFRIGSSSTVWQKLRAAEIDEKVKERVFTVSPVSAAPPVAAIESKRPRFKSKPVAVLSAEAVNYGHDDGEPAVVVTVESKGNIEPMVLSTDDAKKLVTQLLVSLWTNDDEFAQEVLAAKFPHDDFGHYMWPKPA